jgi:hypothetical protein
MKTKIKLNKTMTLAAGRKIYDVLIGGIVMTMATSKKQAEQYLKVMGY